MLDWEAMQTSVFHNNSFLPDDIGDILYCKVDLHLSTNCYLTLSWGYFMYVGWGVVQNYPKS